MSVNGVTMSILQNWEIEVDKTIEELFGAGSIICQDVQVTEARVNVSGEWLGFAIGDYATLVGGGVSGLTDTSVVTTFTVTGTCDDTDGNTLTLTAKSVRFPSIPIGSDKDSWVGITLDGVGKDLEITT